MKNANLKKQVVTIQQYENLFFEYCADLHSDIIVEFDKVSKLMGIKWK